MPEIDLNRKPILNIHSTLSFGKYKGQSVKYVLREDPSYLLWVYEKVEWLSFDETLLDMCEEAVGPYRGQRYRDDDY